MCGLTGFALTEQRFEQAEARSVVQAMANTIRHRGPDDHGEWTNEKSLVAFGHRRLSIIDTSDAGHQPMLSAGGRYVIAYNGEVYNFADIKLLLQKDGHSFRGNSDTEVILAAIEAFGLENAVKRFVGMFAFALWDRRDRTLHLVRDRLGIKPVYYGWVRGAFVFGSELKAIRAFPGFDLPVDRGALALMMRHNCIPAPHTIYTGIRKLLPGTILTVAQATGFREENVTRYWSARTVAENGSRNPLVASEAETIQALEHVLQEAVRMRMIADVPLGAFLSGGYDSSLVVALMQSQSMDKIKTFSIGFSDDQYDEAQFARKVAGHLDTEHTELMVTAAEAMAVIPKLPEMYDEPFSDSSQLPTYLVSSLARKHVTVSLSGDGGDELFAGYNRHVWGKRVGRSIRWSPHALRRLLAKGITGIPTSKWDAIISRISATRTAGDKMHKIAGALNAKDSHGLYRSLVSHWNDPESLVLGSREPLTTLSDPDQHASLADTTAQMMYLDLVTYLPDDILTKLDRASMAVSLEARVPILDHRVVELAWQIPMNMKLRDGQGKWILRQLLYKFVPRELMERPKMGFAIPVGDWLRGPLRDWAESLLDPSRLRQEGYFDADLVRQKWQAHLDGKGYWQYDLWDVLVFQGWLEKQGS